MSTWHSAQSQPKRAGYYDVRSSSGDGERVWRYGSWWQQDYLGHWCPSRWEQGELKWRGPKVQPRVIPPPYIPKP